MVQEAGGTVTAIDGGSLDLNHPEFLASASQPLQGEILRILSQAVGLPK